MTAVTFLFKWHKFLILFDRNYKCLIAKNIVQNNWWIFLALILKQSVQKIVVFLINCQYIKREKSPNKLFDDYVK